MGGEINWALVALAGLVINFIGVLGALFLTRFLIWARDRYFRL